jgi:hypothetical protein
MLTVKETVASAGGAALALKGVLMDSKDRSKFFESDPPEGSYMFFNDFYSCMDLSFHVSHLQHFVPMAILVIFHLDFYSSRLLFCSFCSCFSLFVS